MARLAEGRGDGPGLDSAARRNGVCFRQAEVQHLHMAFLGQEDVLGLQITVEDALAVGGRKT